MSAIFADQGMDAGLSWSAVIAGGTAHMLLPHLPACLKVCSLNCGCIKAVMQPAPAASRMLHFVHLQYFAMY